MKQYVKALTAFYPYSYNFYQMFTLVSHSHYQNEDMYCPTCGWQGHGYQLKESEEIEQLHIREVYCPHCNRYMGQYSTTRDQRNEDISPVSPPTIDWFDAC